MNEPSVPGTVGGFLFEEYYPLKNALSYWIDIKIFD